MELTHSFTVPVGIDRAWAVLTDVEGIAPCMPGAELREVEGDEYRGVVKVKVGPITAQYLGKATITEKDEAGHRIVVRAEGRETRGQGNASANVTATLQADGEATKVDVVTDLNVTGKVAQFGRGVMGDVSNKLLGQFASCLESKLGQTPASEPNPDPKPGAAPVTPGPRTIESAPAEPVDLLGAAGAPVLKRVVPVVAAGVVAYLLFRWLRG
jgi:carbon monoxide dehydrogenase subunit G